MMAGKNYGACFKYLTPFCCGSNNYFCNVNLAIQTLIKKERTNLVKVHVFAPSPEFLKQRGSKNNQVKELNATQVEVL